MEVKLRRRPTTPDTLRNMVRAMFAEAGLFDVYECPICRVSGRLVEHFGRKKSKCWNCHSLERHRLQFCALESLFETFAPADKSALQFAPDAMTPVLRARFKEFRTADLFRDDVDLVLDIRAIDLPDRSVDFVFASHVLEHVDDDDAALAEIYRILKPGGVAVLPVPVLAEQTIEYDRPDADDFDHVRAPGPDYFDKYMGVFDKVVLRRSEEVPRKHQPFYYPAEEVLRASAERTGFTALRSRPISDMVPFCWKRD